jgi:YVTN family beta-propeller protein
VAVTPDGSKVYVASGTTSVSNTVSVIATATNTVIAAISFDLRPFGVVASPDGSKVYVTNCCTTVSTEVANTVSVIETATNTIIATITVVDLATVRAHRHAKGTGTNGDRGNHLIARCGDHRNSGFRSETFPRSRVRNAGF